MPPTGILNAIYLTYLTVGTLTRHSPPLICYSNWKYHNFESPTSYLPHIYVSFQNMRLSVIYTLYIFYSSLTSPLSKPPRSTGYQGTGRMGKTLSLDAQRTGKVRSIGDAVGWLNFRYIRRSWSCNHDLHEPCRVWIWMQLARIDFRNVLSEWKCWMKEYVQNAEWMNMYRVFRDCCSIDSQLQYIYRNCNFHMIPHFRL